MVIVAGSVPTHTHKIRMIEDILLTGFVWFELYPRGRFWTYLALEGRRIEVLVLGARGNLALLHCDLSLG